MKLDEDITVEEARQRLKDMGIPLGEWQNTNPDGDADAFTIPTFVRQAEALKKVAEMLEEQVQRDHNTLAEMSEKLNRIEHGGGR